MIGRVYISIPPDEGFVSEIDGTSYPGVLAPALGRLLQDSPSAGYQGELLLYHIEVNIRRSKIRLREAAAAVALHGGEEGDVEMWYASAADEHADVVRVEDLLDPFSHLPRPVEYFPCVLLAEIIEAGEVLPWEDQTVPLGAGIGIQYA